MMEWFVTAFLKAALAWLALGALFGLGMIVHPAWLAYRPAHLHMNLLGFVTMMIAGVAYHVIPRFTGHPLASRRAAGAHFWLANAGLAVMVAGFVLQGRGTAAWQLVLGVGGTLSTAGILTFVVTLWRTIAGPRGVPTPRPAPPAARRIPVRP
jgi:cbb3-type cytochrome oxidase subunit 1